MRKSTGNVADKADERAKVVAYLEGALADSAKELGKELSNKVQKLLKNSKTSIETLKAISQEVATAKLSFQPEAEAQKVVIKGKGKSDKKADNKKADTKSEKPTDKQDNSKKADDGKDEKDSKEANKKSTKIQKGAPNSTSSGKQDTKKGVETRSLVINFPDTLEIKELGTLHLANDLKGIEDVRKAVEGENKTLIFATYWNERLLKQYAYDVLGIGNPVKKFDNDLDLSQILCINENGKAIITNSLYTEVVGIFKSEDLAIDEETGIRYVNGAEFAIYELEQ